MTTNQTIDGVSRAALEMLIADKAPHYAKTIARKELRAQLDAPEVLVVPLTGPKEWLDSLKPAKGEPVAWYKPHWSGKSAEWRLGAELTDAVFPEMWKPLYAEQPAPVAVVMPEHRDSDLRSPVFGFAKGWNACLDEVARLNK